MILFSWMLFLFLNQQWNVCPRSWCFSNWILKSFYKCKIHSISCILFLCISFQLPLNSWFRNIALKSSKIDCSAWKELFMINSIFKFRHRVQYVKNNPDISTFSPMNCYFKAWCHLTFFKLSNTFSSIGTPTNKQ